jgi:hypothetical protein
MQRKSSALHASLSHLTRVFVTCDAERTNFVIYQAPDPTRISLVGFAKATIIFIPVRTRVGAIVKHLK